MPRTDTGARDARQNSRRELLRMSAEAGYIPCHGCEYANDGAVLEGTTSRRSA
jgi:hypothetical protein